MTRYRKDGQPWDRMYDAWWPAHDQRLTALAGTMPIAEIADALTAEFMVPRTCAAVRVRAKRLGLSLWPKGLSMGEVSRLFGVDHRAIVAWWVEPGLLPAKRWANRGPFDGWWFEMADLERFVREHGYAFDWRRMQAGHPLRSLAEVSARRDPWIGMPELRRYVNIAPINLKKWMARGLVPHQRRYGAGGKGEVMVRAVDLPTIREAIRAAQEHAHQITTAKFTAMRRRQLEVAA